MTTTTKIVLCIVCPVALGALLLGAVALSIDARFRGIERNEIFSGEELFWAHGGRVKPLQPNSIESVRAAFDRGAPGCEIDIYFDHPTRSFVVSHDFPYNLRNGRLLMLDELFREVGDRGYFWLDFKNLGDLDGGDPGRAARRLRALLRRHSLLERSFVESGAQWELGLLARKGILTCWRIDPQAGTFLENLEAEYRIKHRAAALNISALAIPEDVYDERVDAAFAGIPLLVFTVNDEADARRFMGYESVCIVLTDKDYYRSKPRSGDGLVSEDPSLPPR